jgi:hypothetical protein
MKKQISLHLRVEVNIEKLVDAIAENFPQLEIDRDRLEKLFIESLQNGVYDKMPEDLEWRIVNDEYFREFHRKLRDLQTEAEEQLAKAEIREWEHGYWKDVGAA